MFSLRNYRCEGDARLDEMIGAARQSHVPGLSAEARSAILNETLRPATASPEALPALFTPTRRLLIAAGLPVVLAALLLAGLNGGSGTPAGHTSGKLVAVSKDGSDVRFDISNGGRAHFVTRSTSPERFERSSRVRVEGGAYVEHLQDQNSLVFYRID